MNQLPNIAVIIYGIILDILYTGTPIFKGHKKEPTSTINGTKKSANLRKHFISNLAKKWPTKKNIAANIQVVSTQKILRVLF